MSSDESVAKHPTMHHRNTGLRGQGSYAGYRQTTLGPVNEIQSTSYSGIGSLDLDNTLSMLLLESNDKIITTPVGGPYLT